MSNIEPISNDDPRFAPVFDAIYGDSSALPRGICEGLARRVIANLDALEGAGPCRHGDELDLFITAQARREPSFASSFLNSQGISLLRLWLDAWENGGKYPVEGTRTALAGAAASGETT